MEAKTEVVYPEVLHNLCRAFDILNADREQTIFVDPQTLEKLRGVFLEGPAFSYRFENSIAKFQRNDVHIQIDGFSIIFKTLSK